MSEISNKNIDIFNKSNITFSNILLLKSILFSNSNIVINPKLYNIEDISYLINKSDNLKKDCIVNNLSNKTIKNSNSYK